MSNTALLGSYGDNSGAGLMFRNVLINGNFDVWQRGTTTTSASTGVMVADRWLTTVAGTNINYTYARSTDVPNLASAYSLEVTQTAGQNAAISSEYAIRQIIEKQNTLGLVGRPTTVSFWYKSSVTGTHGVRIIGNASGYTGGADQSQSFTVNAANTWEYKTLTFTAVQNVTAVTGDMTGIGMYVDIGPRVGNSIGQTSFAGSAYFRVSQIQTEAGPVATPFERRPIGTELALAQRYYYLHARGVNSPISQAGWYANTLFQGYASFPVAMRIAPNIEYSSGANYYILYWNNTSLQITAPYSSGVYNSTTNYQWDLHISGGLAGAAGALRGHNAAAYVAFNAEL